MNTNLVQQMASLTAQQYVAAVKPRVNYGAGLQRACACSTPNHAQLTASVRWAESVIRSREAGVCRRM